MRLGVFLIFLAISSVAPSSAYDTTCSQLVNGGQNASEDEKRKAQLCHLTELADVLNGMASTLHEALVVVLDEQGVNVDEMMSSKEMEKRGNEYLRFGKRKHEYLRFGKRKNEYLRFGK